MPKVSIVIPVFNKWNLTRNCLKAISANTPEGLYDVLVVDNASSDETATAAPFLGKKLFGDKFHYIRNDANRNFAGASNQGAAIAKGEYLLFLNNDTEVLENWLPPLLQDFDDFSNIAGTGPILLYPETGLLGHTVQHLGVYITPFLRVGHLYAGIPAASPLAHKRRFFQVITGACLLMPAQIFMDAGGFDERFKNGFEDVDLCARISHKGYRFTINPGPRVIHYESQTPGRNAHEAENSRILRDGSLTLLQPDWRAQVLADNMTLRLGPWQCLHPALSQQVGQALEKLKRRLDFSRLLELLIQNPYWESGWQPLLELPEAAPYKEELHSSLFELLDNPMLGLAACKEAMATDEKKAAAWLNRISFFSRTYENYAALGHLFKAWLESHDEKWLADEYADWLSHGSDFRQKLLAPFLSQYLQLNQILRKFNDPDSTPVYAAWLESIDGPARVHYRAVKGRLINSAPGFSILMRVNRPQSTRLAGTIQSLLNQTFAKWELIALCSEDAPVLQKLDDSRIRCIACEAGQPAKALNAGLQRAAYPWAIIVDQDDQLPEDALALLAAAISSQPEAMLAYGGDDRLSDNLETYNPYFKSGWDPLLAMQQDYLHRLAAFRREKALTLGGFREKFALAHEFDFFLRYCRNLKKDAILHIPQILYHVNKDTGRRIIGLDADEAQSREGLLALREHLDRTMPGARAELVPGNIFHISWADGDTPITIICDMGTASNHRHAAFIQHWQAADALIILGEAGADPGPKTRVLAPPRNLSSMERLNWAAQMADTALIGFVRQEIVPASSSWRREIAGFASYPKAGAWSGKISFKDNFLLHGGYLGDAHGNLRPIFKYANPAHIDWFNWIRLARTVLALGGECLFTSRDVFLQNNGLDQDMGECAFQDYCLRLSQAGLVCAWLPWAKFIASDYIHLPDESNGFSRKWQGILPAFNDNLIVEGPFFGLTRFPKLLRMGHKLSKNLRSSTN